MGKKLYICKKADGTATLVITAVFVTVCVCMLAMPETSISGAKSGLEYSFGILIPSLFPFMFLSDFAVDFGISQRLSGVLGKFTEKVFYLPGESGVTILLSLIGGFPVGASGINALLKQNKITQPQARRMLCFCVNSGPAFMISVVGAELYRSTFIGVILYAAQILASVTVGIAVGIFARKKELIQRGAYNAANKKYDFSRAFISSCKSACCATVNLCALVVLFSTLSAIIFNLFSIEKGTVLYNAISTLLEVTSGCGALAESGVPIFFTSLAIGWSGLCVHFQVFSAAEGVKINKASFALARFINGILSAAVTFALTLLFGSGQDVQVFSNITENEQAFSSSTFYGSAALLCASVLFLVFINSYIRSTDKTRVLINN